MNRSKAQKGPTAEEVRLVEEALAMSRKAWGKAQPNPMVGCIILDAEGNRVGEGIHEEFGGPHAEANALKQAGAKAKGGTVFVSLEPCNHRGKTPPCVKTLIKAKVAKVVYGATDPEEKSGGGRAALEEAGIEVEGPVFDKRRMSAEHPFLYHRARTKAPFVALKLSFSRDGMISELSGERSEITGPETEKEVHRLRAGYESILVGSETQVVDNPLLTVRGKVKPRVPPMRIVFDARGRVAPRSKLFNKSKQGVMIVTSNQAPKDRIKALEKAGAVVRVVSSEGFGVDLGAALKAVQKEKINSVFCEGGGVLAKALLDADLVDRFYLFRGPEALGPDGVPGLGSDFQQLERWLHAARGGAELEGWRRIGQPTPFGEDTLTVFDRVR